MSESFSPAFAIAFSAASACNWICDMFGITPSSVVSAAPTMATWFLRMISPLGRTEQGKGDLVVKLFELDLDPHVEFERFRSLRAVDDIGHHPRTFIELHHGDGIGRGKAGGGAMMDDVAVKLALAAGLENRDLARGAGGAERTRRKIDVRTGLTALQAKLAGSGAIPEMLGFRCWFRFGARGFGHVGLLRDCCDLDATLNGPASTV